MNGQSTKSKSESDSSEKVKEVDQVELKDQTDEQESISTSEPEATTEQERKSLLTNPRKPRKTTRINQPVNLVKTQVFIIKKYVKRPKNLFCNLIGRSFQMN